MTQIVRKDFAVSRIVARFRWGTLAALALMATLASGCKPKVGGRCSTGQMACEDGHGALFCEDGKYAEMTCSGPDGCVQSGKQGDCDNSIANKGDGCSEGEALACTADKKGELRCRADQKSDARDAGPAE